MAREIVHELGHSIDPNLGKRSGKEEMLDEFGTYYRGTYEPEVITQTTTKTDGQGHSTEPVVTRRESYDSLHHVTLALRVPYYVAKYGKAFASPEEYAKKVDSIAEVINQLETFFDKPRVNTIIFNAQSEYELRHLLQVCEHEKRGL